MKSNSFEFGTVIYQFFHFTSTFELGIQFSINIFCRKIEETNLCNQVTGDEQLTFNVSVTLSQDGCEVSQGGVVVSIGIGGVREIVAVLIIPSCGCECTKIENQVRKNQIFMRQNVQQGFIK